jgi:hypothetical protein
MPSTGTLKRPAGPNSEVDALGTGAGSKEFLPAILIHIDRHEFVNSRKWTYRTQDSYGGL